MITLTPNLSQIGHSTQGPSNRQTSKVPKQLDQSEGDFAPQEHMATSRDIFIVTTGGRGRP